MEREQYAAGKRKARYSLPVVLPFNCGPDDLLDLCWFMLPRDYIDETGDAYWHWYQSTL
jgi:hypothetical protein